MVFPFRQAPVPMSMRSSFQLESFESSLKTYLLAVKRRMREAVRQRRSVLQGAGAVDVVINPKKSVLTLEFSLVLEEVGRALDTIAKKLVTK